VPFGMKTGFLLYCPPPTGSMVEMCAERELIGTGGYNWRATNASE
jgi:hypothetical protein